MKNMVLLSSLFMLFSCGHLQAKDSKVEKAQLVGQLEASTALLKTNKNKGVGNMYEHYEKAVHILLKDSDKDLYKNVLKTVPPVLKAYRNPQIFEMFAPLYIKKKTFMKDGIQNELKDDEAKEFIRRLEIVAKTYQEGNG